MMGANLAILRLTSKFGGHPDDAPTEFAWLEGEALYKAFRIWRREREAEEHFISIFAARLQGQQHWRRSLRPFDADEVLLASDHEQAGRAVVGYFPGRLLSAYDINSPSFIHDTTHHLFRQPRHSDSALRPCTFEQALASTGMPTTVTAAPCVAKQNGGKDPADL